MSINSIDSDILSQIQAPKTVLPQGIADFEGVDALPSKVVLHWEILDVNPPQQATTLEGRGLRIPMPIKEGLYTVRVMGTLDGELVFVLEYKIPVVPTLS